MNAIWRRIQTASEQEISFALNLLGRLLLARGMILLILFAIGRFVLTPESMLIRGPWGILHVSSGQLRWMALSFAVLAFGIAAYARKLDLSWYRAVLCLFAMVAAMMLAWSFGVADPQLLQSVFNSTSQGSLLLATFVSGTTVAWNSVRDTSHVGVVSKKEKSVWLNWILSTVAFVTTSIAWAKLTMPQNYAEIAVISLVAAVLLFLLRQWVNQVITEFLTLQITVADNPSSFASKMRRPFVEIPESPFHWGDGIIICGGVALGGYLFWLGTPPQYLYPHDLFIYYDAAWRIVCGQRPHADYASAIGPLPQFLYAVGWWLAREKGNSLAYGHAIFALSMLVCAWRVARTRFPAAMTLLFVTFIVANSAALTCFGDAPFKSTFSMAPNRYGHSMLCIYTIIIFARVADDRARWRFRDAMIAGSLLAGMLFCKISFFVVGVGLIPAAILSGGVSRLDVGGILCGLLLGSLPWFALSGFDLAALLRDYSISFAVNRESLMGSVIRSCFGSNGLIVMAAAACSYVMALHNRASMSKAARIAVVCGFLFVAGIVIREGDGQPAFITPLWLASLFCICEFLQRLHARQWGLVLIAISCLWSLRAQVACDLNSIVSPVIPVSPEGAAFRRSRLVFKGDEFHSVPGMEGLRINDARYAAQIEEGRRLVQSHLGPGRSLVAFGFSNPFQCICRLRPPARGMLWWHDKRNFDIDHYPPAATVFSDATHVLVLQPNAYERMATRDVLAEIYGNELSAHFQIVGESESFVLWARKQQGRVE